MPNVTLEREVTQGGRKTWNGRSYLWVKRGFDVLASAMACILLAIPMLLIALVIKLDSPGPVIYKHRRAGKNGKHFQMYKFRTMYINADEMFQRFTPEQKEEWNKNFKLENDPRVTRVGKFLRKSSMDELPQFLNILKGELSVVGPRPITDKELELYGEDKALLLSITPGLTGYWQTYARSDCSYAQRIEMELSYAKNANFWWDVKIMFATVGSVIRGRGAK